MGQELHGQVCSLSDEYAARVHTASMVRASTRCAGGASSLQQQLTRWKPAANSSL
jgi:hypothetical protein